MAESTDGREVWLPVPDYATLYEVSNLGRIRRALYAPARSLGVPGKVLRPNTNGPYVTVSLSNEGVTKSHRLHLLILRAFCGEQPFDGAHGAHNDGNTRNNKLSNLRWATPKENQADVTRHGRRCQGVNVFGAVLNDDNVREIRSRINNGERNPSIANDYGVSPSTIHLIRHNRIWRHVA